MAAAASLVALTAAIRCGGDRAVARVHVAAYYILPLACIWFADGMGSYTGRWSWLFGLTSMQSTPGDAVALGGWLLLLLPIVMLLVRLL